MFFLFLNAVTSYEHYGVSNHQQFDHFFPPVIQVYTKEIINIKITLSLAICEGHPLMIFRVPMSNVKLPVRLVVIIRIAYLFDIRNSTQPMYQPKDLYHFVSMI